MRKKVSTHGSISRKNRSSNTSSIDDPSVQRLMENCSRELNSHYRSLHDRERRAVKKAMTEKRARYCTFVQCLKPIISEEFGMLSEISQVEDVMQKLLRITSTPEILPKLDEEVNVSYRIRKLINQKIQFLIQFLCFTPLKPIDPTKYSCIRMQITYCLKQFEPYFRLLIMYRLMTLKTKTHFHW